MRAVLAGLIALVAVVLIVVLARYETLSPCRILRHDLAAAGEREAGALGALTGALGADIVTQVQNSTPGECLDAWVTLHTDGPEAALRGLTRPE